jgi:hypothetical protein
MNISLQENYKTRRRIEDNEGAIQYDVVTTADTPIDTKLYRSRRQTGNSKEINRARNIQSKIRHYQ